jgi:predicted GNAT family acetyltransferase
MRAMATLERIDDPATFLREAGAFLTEREAEHNLLLGLAGRAIDEPAMYGERVYEAVVRDDAGAVVAAALRTPPFNLLLSETDDLGSIELVATDALEAFGSLPGVLGPAADAARFAHVWRSLTGTTTTLEIAQRIHRAERVEPPSDVPGSPRLASPADRPLLLGWVDAFLTEALPVTSRLESPADHLDRRERDPDAGYLLWELDEDPVSMAGWAGTTPTGTRIGPVYTPPEHRGHGFASAVTASLTDRFLRGGRRFCFLFTDLANPTSNAIYRRIGYEPVADVDQYRFDPPGA